MAGTYDDFAELALKPEKWPMTTGGVSVPVLSFNVSRERHWKFTPQCDVFPIAKSICLMGFREVAVSRCPPVSLALSLWNAIRSGQQWNANASGAAARALAGRPPGRWLGTWGFQGHRVSGDASW